MLIPAPVRPLRHPGPMADRRRESVAARSRTVHATLPPHTRLLDAVISVVGRTGCASAQIELMGGTLSRVSYCVPEAGTDGSAAVAYSPTRHARTPAQLLAASATFGRREGKPFLHCHASWLDADGTLGGGHLWQDTTTGDVPVYVVVHTLPGVELTSATDSETRMPAFTPAPAAVRHPTGNVVISRVRPGEDLSVAAEEISAEHGFPGATVRAGLGSLVGARLCRAATVWHVDGPGTEVVAVAGKVRPGHAAGEAALSAILVDRHGVVHAGRLLRGHNLVAVTFELLLIRDDGGAGDG
ncbi:hypothetical protein BAY61_17785 [Prauserella marina]|uniref:Uncharacterized protein n=1 Tax=Prauserella marina TaxID=530584 RepID=A0A222VZQ3_9PSEU|nr:DUF296 domain-containing protein [Prauserella marina]ASR39399.1 hypothetical protein BAY61_17785 [Prauserella marina]PWV73942.1 hypothetical protein DES30_108115 [Prauserella marina]SDD59450.1 protein of unknown function [Prauserella marina]